MATSTITRYQSPLELKECTVVLANTQVMAHSAGAAIAYKLDGKRYMVFMTLGITFSTGRQANLSLFKLQVDGTDLFIIEPYSIPTAGPASNGVQLTSYNSEQHQWITIPYGASAGDRVNVTGVAIFSAD